MGILENFCKQPNTTKVFVEVFKGQLEKDAIVDSAKKEFSENENLKEAVFITKGASENVWTKAMAKLNFELNVSEDLRQSFLIMFNNDKNSTIVKVQVIISESIEESFGQFLANNSYILRILK